MNEKLEDMINKLKEIENKELVHDLRKRRKKKRDNDE